MSKALSEQEGISIKILNWDKYNPRKDVKNSTWLRLQHDLFESWQFFDFTHSEMAFWIYLLCQASRRSDEGKVTVNFEHAHRVAKFTRTVMNSAIKKLKKNQVVEVKTLLGRYADVNETCSTKRTKRRRDGDVTDETNERNETGRDEKQETFPSETTLSLSDQNHRYEVDIQPKKSLPDKITQTGIELRRRIWSTYLESYRERYRSDPVRNDTVNSQIVGLSKRLGEEAVEVVRFYVKHNKGFYVEQCHPIGLCLKDAEALRTQWFRGKTITSNDVRDFERRDHTRSLLEKIENGEL